MKILLILIYLIISFVSVNAQVMQEWVRRYDSFPNHDDHPYYISLDSSNNIIIAGFGYEGMNLIKYDPNGNLIWSRRYLGNQNILPRPSGIGIDKDNNIYLVGNAVTGVIVKYNADGILLWDKNYPSGDGGLINDIKIDNNNFVYIAGSKIVSFSNSDFLISKIDSIGDTVWTFQYNKLNGLGSYAKEIVLDSLNNIYCIGGISFSNSYADLIALKIGNSGVLQWDTTIDCSSNTTDDLPISIDIDFNGNLYVLSNLYPISNNNTNFCILKINNIGNVVWKRIYNGGANSGDVGTKLLTCDNFVYIGGRSAELPPYWDQYCILKYDLNGNNVWTKYYGEMSFWGDYLNDLVIDKFENLYITGSSFYSTTNDRSEYLTYKIDPEGNIKWSEKFRADTSFNGATNVILDSNEDVYITGSSSVNQRFDIFTIKYSQTVGITNNQILPQDFSLSQNFPNPFNSSTRISLSIDKKSDIKLIVYDLLGKEITRLFEGTLNYGVYNFDWNAANVSSGVYLYRVETDKSSITKSMVVLK